MDKFSKIIRYIISGGTAAVINLVALRIFVEVFNIWYIYSAIYSFLIAFCVSFTLQKFWTFNDRQTHKIKSQTTIYFLVSVTNLGVNTLLMYIFVDFVHIHYFLSQILSSGLLAISSYFIYSLFIFKNTFVAIDTQNTDNL